MTHKITLLVPSFEELCGKIITHEVRVLHRNWPSLVPCLCDKLEKRFQGYLEPRLRGILAHEAPWEHCQTTPQATATVKDVLRTAGLHWSEEDSRRYLLRGIILHHFGDPLNAFDSFHICLLAELAKDKNIGHTLKLALQWRMWQESSASADNPPHASCQKAYQSLVKAEKTARLVLARMITDTFDELSTELPD